MARRAHVYPQVEVGAAALIDASVLAAPADLSAGEALRLARRRDAHALAFRERLVLRDDLARAAALGVERERADALARPLPAVDARAPEARVRRLLEAGAPLVAVTEHRRVIGGIRPPGTRHAAMSMTDRLMRRLPQAARDVLVAATRAATARGARAYLAGGVVRDALADRPLESPDIDIVVEGDGPGVARALAEALGAPLVTHERFLTATVGPTAAGRIDVATARSERYETRGALPRVLPASIDADLRRRDFTVNAMAVELCSGVFGLLDPHGGRHDLAAGRLRILHPASFVEDPTRIFRAARYAERLGLRPDAWTTQAQTWALSLVPYPALSGARVLAELSHVVREIEPDAIVLRLARAGAFALVDPRLRYSRLTRAMLARWSAARRWAHGRALAVSEVELLLFSLLAAQEPAVAAAALRRLDITGEPAARLERALVRRDRIVAELGAASRPSERARVVRGVSALELAWLGGGTEGELSGVDDARPSLRGDDLIALGIPPGPVVATALEALRDARLDGELKTRSEEEAFVRAWARAGDGRGPSRPGSSRKEW